MSRSAVLAGRTTSDLVRNFFVMILMCIVGFAVGWRIVSDVWGLIAMILLILAFSYSLSWIFAFVGLSVKDPETAQAASFPLLAPLVFASSARLLRSLPLTPSTTRSTVDATDAARLDLALGRPILVVDSTDVDAAGTPLLTTRSRFAAERIEFLVENG